MNKLTIRAACKQRKPLSGVDAQALEGALQQAEACIQKLQLENDELRTAEEGLWLSEREEHHICIQRLEKEVSIYKDLCTAYRTGNNKSADRALIRLEALKEKHISFSELKER